MAVNQVGAGGIQNVDLYRNNQENISRSPRQVFDKLERADSVKGIKVDLSPESVRLSQQGQEQDNEIGTEQRNKRLGEQQVTQIEDKRQANTFKQQVKIDLFT